MFAVFDYSEVIFQSPNPIKRLPRVRSVRLVQKSVEIKWWEKSSLLLVTSQSHLCPTLLDVTLITGNHRPVQTLRDHFLSVINVQIRPKNIFYLQFTQWCSAVMPLFFHREGSVREEREGARTQAISIFRKWIQWRTLGHRVIATDEEVDGNRIPA